MRLAVCALSAILLSGCSWFGGGSSNYDQDFSAAGTYGTNCGPVQGYGYAQPVYAQPGCDVAGGYGVANAGHGAQAYGAGVAAHTSGVYGGSHYYAGGAEQIVQGSPIYVPQPYAAPVATGCCGPQLRGSGGALPFGLEASIGTEFGIGGNIFPGEAAKASAPTLNVSELDPISYNDAFGTPITYELGATYDVGPSTTLLARVGYLEADGKRLQVGTVNNGATPAVTEDLFGEFGDLEQVRLEGGVRQYFGGLGNSATGIRPYVGATAGAVYTDDVDLVQSSDTLVSPTTFTQNYVDSGWKATASGIIGAEWQVGSRTALGVETGIRWSDDVDSNFTSGDRWAIPLQLRGRVSF